MNERMNEKCLLIPLYAMYRRASYSRHLQRLTRPKQNILQQKIMRNMNVIPRKIIKNFREKYSFEKHQTWKTTCNGFLKAISDSI